MKYMKQTAKEETEQPTEVVLTHTALGTFQDVKTGKWLMAKIRYNPETGDVGQLEAISNEEGGRDAVNYRFKIATVKEGILT